MNFTSRTAKLLNVLIVQVSKYLNFKLLILIILLNMICRNAQSLLLYGPMYLTYTLYRYGVIAKYNNLRKEMI